MALCVTMLVFKLTEISQLLSHQHLGHLSDIFVQSDIHGGGCHAGCRPAHQEQFGVWYLTQLHLHMQTRAIEPATFQQQDAGSTHDPQLPAISHVPRQ